MDTTKENEYLSCINKIIKRKNINIATFASFDDIIHNVDVFNQVIDNILLDEFCEFGLNIDSEPNDYGLYIDKIITFLNRIRLFGSD